MTPPEVGVHALCHYSIAAIELHVAVCDRPRPRRVWSGWSAANITRANMSGAVGSRPMKSSFLRSSGQGARPFEDEPAIVVIEFNAGCIPPENKKPRRGSLVGASLVRRISGSVFTGVFAVAETE